MWTGFWGVVESLIEASDGNVLRRSSCFCALLISISAMVPSYRQIERLTLRLITSRVRDAATSPNDELIEIIIKFDR